MVKNHLVGSVFEQWAHKTKKIGKFKAKRSKRLLTGWFEAWNTWSSKHLKLAKTKKMIENKKRSLFLQSLYDAILKFAVTKIFERKAVKEFREALVER